MSRTITIVSMMVLQMAPNVNTSDVNTSVCQQRHIQPPQGSERCVSDTEVYISKTGLHQYCTWLCMRNPKCQVINFNILDSLCLIGERPCLSVENDTDFLTIIMSTKKPCLRWVKQHDKDEDKLISVLEDNGSSHSVSVVRCIMENNKIPGKFVSRWGEAFFSWEGNEKHCAKNQTEILIVSRECNISWLPHDSTSGDPLPAGAVIGGQLNGTHLYVSRKYAVHVTGYNAEYSLGYYDSVSGLGHFPFLRLDFTYQEVEILVVQELTQWNQDKMATISQTTFSNAFLEWKYLNLD